jgi:hypothetical protein
MIQRALKMTKVFCFRSGGRRLFSKKKAFLPFFFLLVSAAAAQTTHLQDAIITGHDQTILIRRLPIDTPQGRVLRDVRITLQADSQGNVTVASRTLVAPTAVPGARAPAAEPGVVSRPSAPLVVQKFLAGTYQSVSDRSLINVIDLGIPIGHDTPRFSLSGIGAPGPLAGATWDAGPVETNSLRNRIARAGIDPGGFSFGTSDGGGDVFDTGALLGFQQTGNIITVVTYRHGCCSDHATPTAKIIYERVAG